MECKTKKWQRRGDGEEFTTFDLDNFITKLKMGSCHQDITTIWVYVILTLQFLTFVSLFQFENYIAIFQKKKKVLLEGR